MDLSTDVQKAIDLLRNEFPVALPTETVYGLAARIDSTVAIEKIFQIKKRPFFDPLIVHVHNIEQAKNLVSVWPNEAEILAKKFWPGPLTLVLPKKNVSDMITSGLDTVALRVPNHPLFLKVLRELNTPLAAPSANLFGRTSPTTADHVSSEFKDSNLFVLDGGPCSIGIESTVVRIIPKDNSSRIEILRKGHITESELKASLIGFSTKWTNPSEIQHSPGHTQHHYMPRVPFVISLQPRTTNELIRDIGHKLQNTPDVVEGVTLVKPAGPLSKVATLNLSADATIAARIFYSELRKLADSGCDIIVFFKNESHNNESWQALLDRATKASSLIL